MNTRHKHREEKSGCQESGTGRTRERLLKRYRLLTIGRIRSEDLMQNMMTIVDNTVFKTKTKIVSHKIT